MQLLAKYLKKSKHVSIHYI